MIDIIVRHCGRVGWLPIIVATDSGAELYRGSHHPTAEAAVAKAMEVWENSATGNIQEFRRERGV